MDKRTLLKIKGLSLAQEARIIKRMQKKRPARAQEMHNHRVNVVRPLARSTHLAYGFLRGKTKEDMELTCYTKPNGLAIRQLVNRYGITTPLGALDDPDGYAEYLRELNSQTVRLDEFLKEWE